MYYQKTLILSEKEADKIEFFRLTKGAMQEHETITNSITFENGMKMDIVLYGTGWVKAILLENGKEVGCSLCGFYFDKFDLEYNKDRYTVIVDWKYEDENN